MEKEGESEAIFSALLEFSLDDPSPTLSEEEKPEEEEGAPSVKVGSVTGVEGVEGVEGVDSLTLETGADTSVRVSTWDEIGAGSAIGVEVGIDSWGLGVG